MTTRRSFLTLLGLAPIAANVAPAAAAVQAKSTYGLVTNHHGQMAMGKISNADGSFVIDFDNFTISIRDDVYSDGPITAHHALDDDGDEEFA